MVTQANCDVAFDRYRSEALSPTTFFLPLHLFHFKTISCGIGEVAMVEIVKVMTTIGPYKSFT
jgi:hypothetical protein